MEHRWCTDNLASPLYCKFCQNARLAILTIKLSVEHRRKNLHTSAQPALQVQNRHEANHRATSAWGNSFRPRFLSIRPRSPMGSFHHAQKRNDANRSAKRHWQPTCNPSRFTRFDNVLLRRIQTTKMVLDRSLLRSLRHCHRNISRPLIAPMSRPTNLKPCGESPYHASHETA